MLPYLPCPLVFVVFPDFLETSKYDLKRTKAFSADCPICFTAGNWKALKNGNIGMKWVKKRS